MTSILEMRSFVCVILMSVQFVVACAAIYNATQSFLYKIRLWKPISAVIIAVISLTMFLVSTHVLSKIYYDNQINKMAEFFGRMPFALSVGITAYCAVMSVYITVRLHRCRNTDITAMSIKESFDGLPTGLCYFDENGLVVLKNNLMESICLELTGKSLNVAMPFREKIKEASQYENDGAFTVRLKDGRVFSFSLSETEIFSNTSGWQERKHRVLLPYRFTLFSNLKLKIKCTHYTVHGKSIRIFYNICIMIVNKIHTNHYQSQQVFRIQKLLSALSFQC